MLKLRTKTEFPIPTKRGVKTGIIHMIIDSLSMNDNNIIPSGYYYYFDEDNQVVQIDTVKHLQFWDNVEVAENELIALGSNKNLKSNLLQRLKEFTFLILQSEAGQNFGTNAEDWEIEE